MKTRENILDKIIAPQSDNEKLEKLNEAIKPIRTKEEEDAHYERVKKTRERMSFWHNPGKP